MNDLTQTKRKNFSKNNIGQRKASDFYETPYSMTRQLLEVENFNRKLHVLEPACGGLAIYNVLLELGFKEITGTDIDHGYDFLEFEPADFKWDYIITNPPYSLALEFILKAKEVASEKIAMLLPTDYLHGLDRFEKLFQDTAFPLKSVYTFVRRPMLGEPLREDGKYNTGMQTYAWYVWDKNHSAPPKLGWINNQEFVLKAGEE